MCIDFLQGTDTRAHGWISEEAFDAVDNIILTKALMRGESLNQFVTKALASA